MESRADGYAEMLLPALRGGCQETDRQTSEQFTEPSPGPISELMGFGRIKAGALSQELDHTLSQTLGLIYVIFCLCSTEIPWVLAELWLHTSNRTFAAAALGREKDRGLTVLSTYTLHKGTGALFGGLCAHFLKSLQRANLF